MYLTLQNFCVFVVQLVEQEEAISATASEYFFSTALNLKE